MTGSLRGKQDDLRVGDRSRDCSDWRKEPQVKECMQPPATEKGKKTDSPLDPPEGTHPAYLDVRIPGL